MNTVRCYELKNKNIQAKILNLGGIVQSLSVPDENGVYRDVALGFDTPEEYLNSDTYFGAIVGRYANRIANGCYEIGGKEFLLEKNNGNNNLHSGKNGFHQYLFDAYRDDNKPNRLELVGEDEHLNQGFPGNLKVKIIYELMESSLEVSYEAVSDMATPINMTWHGYFNLNGHESGDILNHEMQINARHYTPFSDENMIPSGEVISVEGTPFDFSIEKTIGRDIGKEHRQLQIAGGYDHNFVIDSMEEEVAFVVGDRSGITMRVFTDRPCMQLYTGNFITTQKGKCGATYKHRQGFCMETQTYPNAVNCKEFPADILKPGEIYKTKTRYEFGTRVSKIM